VEVSVADVDPIWVAAISGAAALLGVLVRLYVEPRIDPAHRSDVLTEIRGERRLLGSFGRYLDGLVDGPPLPHPDPLGGALMLSL
jgi:hypothetical protein